MSILKERRKRVDRDIAKARARQKEYYEDGQPKGYYQGDPQIAQANANCAEDYISRAHTYRQSLERQSKILGGDIE